MQDVESPAHIERLSQLARARRSRVQVEPCTLVPSSKRLDDIVRDHRRRRDVGQRSSVRSSEPQLPIGLSFHLIPLLVDGAVMAPTEHREVRERSRPAMGPVADVMALAKRQAAAGEPAPVVAVMQRAP